MTKRPEIVVKGDRPTEDDKLRQVDTTQEELDHTQFVSPEGMPTYWRDHEGKTHLRSETQIVYASGDDIARYGKGDNFVCGFCKFFDLESGRKEMVQQGFAEKLVHDYEWKTRHLGRIDSIGLCGASGGETVTPHYARACDQFRPRGSSRASR